MTGHVDLSNWPLKLMTLIRAICEFVGIKFYIKNDSPVSSDSKIPISKIEKAKVLPWQLIH